MSAVDPHAEAHRLNTVHGWGARRIGAELGISRYAAGELLKRPLPQPVADQVAEPVGHVAEEMADQPSTVAVRAAVTPPPCDLLVIDLARFPGLADDLALLRSTRATAAQIVNFAIDRLASSYRTARARGRLREGQAFDVTGMWLKPSTAPPAGG